MKKILVLTLGAFIALSSFAQEDFNFDEIDFDNMFSEEDTVIEEVEDKSDTVAAPSVELLTTKGVEWGGSFSSSISGGVTYKDLPKADTFTKEENFTEDFSANLSASMHFNARPNENTRFYGKVSTKLPFTTSAEVLVPNPTFDPLVPTSQEGRAVNVSIPLFEINELFTDFNVKNKLFFRVGKQNAKWGVGYFFSPADFLSLAPIDPENPTADREGPIAIRMSMPFGINNASMHISVPNSIFTSKEPSVTDLIFAPKATFLVKDVELSSGIFYQKDLSPRAMVAATYSTNTNAGKFSFFGEFVGQYGSDKTFVNSDYTTKTVEYEFFFNGTAGFMWSKTLKENNFSFVAQYLYNGEGYGKEEGKVISNIISKDIPMEYMQNAISLADKLTMDDLINRNMHYLGLNFGISNLFDNEDLSISAFSMMNLVDLSGFVKPSISYSITDDISTTLGTSFNFSQEGGEYLGDRFSLNLSVRLGGGSF